MSIDPTLATLLASTSGRNALAGVEPDTGEGTLGEWPPEGDHACFVTDVAIKAADFKFAKASNLPPVPGIYFQFSYTNQEKDPTRTDGEALSWTGAPITLPINEAAIAGISDTEKGVGARIKMGKQRLMGLVQATLGPASSGAITDYGALATMLATRLDASKADGGRSFPIAKIKVTKRADKQKVDKFWSEEFGVQNIAT